MLGDATEGEGERVKEGVGKRGGGAEIPFGGGAAFILRRFSP